MDRKKIRFMYVAVTFAIAIAISFIAMRLLPENFPYRTNTSDSFHMAKHWELFMTPCFIPIAYLLFQFIYKWAKQIHDFAKELIADFASYLFPLFILYIHIYFISESIQKIGI